MKIFWINDKIVNWSSSIINKVHKIRRIALPFFGFFQSRTIFWIIFALGFSFIIFRDWRSDDVKKEAVGAEQQLALKMSQQSSVNRANSTRLHADSLRVKLDQISDDLSKEERYFLQRQLVEELVKDRGLLGALSWIETSFAEDSGKKSDLLLMGLLSAPELDSTLLDVLQRPEYKEIADRWAGLIENPFGTLPKVNITIEELVGFDPQSLGSQKFVGLVVGELLSSNPADDAQLFLTLKSLNLTPMSLSDCLSQLSRSKPKVALNLVINILNEDPKRDVKFAMVRIVDNLIEGGFQDAAAIVIDNYGGLGADPVAQVFRSWIDYDISEVVKWLDTHGGKLEISIQDGISKQFAGKAVTEREFDTARLWAESVTDAAVKKSIDDEIWLAERKILLDQVKTDPVTAVSALVRGDTGFQDFYIKDAFESWFEADFDAANRWYLENKAQIPDHKKQHIARAYTNEAIAAGDLDLAQQWLTQVVDPTFKSALEAKIESAVKGAAGK